MAEVFSISGAASGPGMGFARLSPGGMPWYRRIGRGLLPPPPPPPGYLPPPPPPPWQRRRHHLFGNFGATCPAGFATTPKGNCQGPAAASLQNALRALGRAVGGDVGLLNLAVDGSIGPLTAAAVNRAFTTHIGAGQAPAALRTGALGIMDVAANIAPITQLVTAEVTRRGGSIAPVGPAAGGARPPAYTPPQATAADVASGPGFPATTWALVGLAVIAAGAGAYFVFAPDASAPARARRR
jgi:hypothetical protein